MRIAMQTVMLGGVVLTFCDTARIGELFRGLVGGKRPVQIVTFNALMFNEALKDSDFQKVLASSLAVIDSAGVAWAVRLLTGYRLRRCAGIDLLHLLCGQAAHLGYSIFLLGARPGVADAAAERLSALYPGLTVAGALPGYFSPDEENGVRETIRKARPGILFVAFATPRQEKWIAENREALGVPLVMGVGGSFDVVAGRLRRAPGWMRRTGLEWLFRLLQEPWRFFRILGLSLFVYNVLKLKLSGTRSLSTGR